MHIKQASHPTRRTLHQKQPKRSLNTLKLRRRVDVGSETSKRTSSVRFEPLSLRTKDQRDCESFERAARRAVRTDDILRRERGGGLCFGEPRAPPSFAGVLEEALLAHAAPVLE